MLLIEDEFKADSADQRKRALKGKAALQNPPLCRKNDGNVWILFYERIIEERRGEGGRAAVLAWCALQYNPPKTSKHRKIWPSGLGRRKERTPRLGEGGREIVRKGSHNTGMG